MIKLLIIAIFFLISCQVKDSEQNNVSDSLNISKNDNSIFIKDSIYYSDRFLKEMENLGLKNVSLVDSFLILEDNDTMTFPQTPIIGKRTVLTGKKDELAISLTIERINQSTIDYKIEMVESGNTVFLRRTS
jgi:thioredoxin-related protein